MEQILTPEKENGEQEQITVNIGPQHPSTHGVLRLVVTLDGERVVKCDPVVGYLHRALEKIAENRTYTQFIPLTDRVDYCASMNSNLPWVMAVEKLAGIKPPPRAEYIRVIVCELNRIASHLVWWGTNLLDLGAVTPFNYAFRDRELILDLFEMLCGARLLYSYMRIGGVAKDLPDEFIPKTRKFIKHFRKVIKDYDRLVTGNVIFQGRTKNVGILTPEMAIGYGVTGPNLRASGVDWDLRRDDPYSAYPELKFEVPVGKNGDCFDRYQVRMDEMRQSCNIVEQCLNKLPSGPVRLQDLPYKLRLPKGEVYVRTEAPRGEMGVYLVSDGKEKPYRAKIRTGSFSNLSVFPAMLPGTLFQDMVAISGSMDFIMPEIDR
ncbi:MAG: NADH-quinone oxidoreductase subunit D [Candidatus Eremiobacteraeota bacterium]|nr:NADH-quinone oxidoreductase subunit D [Candidatus Eremiobacteraeota bacterium]